MSFQRILVAIGEEPIAAHAVDGGIELAGGLGAKLAFIHVIDPDSVAMPDGGIPASDSSFERSRPGKRLLAAFRQRMTADLLPLEFVNVGSPAAPAYANT